jgi:hypothetical protein
MMGLPSLNSLDRAQGARIWLATEATDMRCGLDRLAQRVGLLRSLEQQYQKPGIEQAERNSDEDTPSFVGVEGKPQRDD